MADYKKNKRIFNDFHLNALILPLKRFELLGHIRTSFDYFERAQALLVISRGILEMVVNAKYFSAYFERLSENR